jgi:hypothetical protein
MGASKPAPRKNSLAASLSAKVASLQSRQRFARLAKQVRQHARPEPEAAPVVVFNASTRLGGLSQNAAFSLLTAWSLRLSGYPVVHFVCRSGMSHCVLGTDRQDYHTPPPCAACIAQSDRIYSGAQVESLSYQEDPALSAGLSRLDVEQLSHFEVPAPVPGSASTIPLGSLALPSARWALRRHTLPDDEPTRYLLRAYMLSAYNIAREFSALLGRVQPQVVVVFNGLMYPEAAARWACRQMKVRSVAHEVGYQRFSVFFTEGDPTAYPIDIPPDLTLSDEQNARIDAYLEQRFQGRFSMAGIQFWPEMRGLDEAFLQKASGFRQIVPVFTNVIYDTSQVHANVLFSHMFAWLDAALESIGLHPDTLFVIRAHPDEMRPGSAKQSRESVHDWVKSNRVDELPNVVFIDSQEYISSYELILRSKFVMVYNSSIGLEATLMGKAVLCAGKARYTQIPTVFFPPALAEYNRMVETMLAADEITVPSEFKANARRFLYYQLYRASLPLDEFLQSGRRMGFVELRDFAWQALLPKNSPALNVITDGILQSKPFLMPEN